MKAFLSVQEVSVLKEAHRASRSKRHADRIKTILLLDQGYSYSQVSKLLLLDDTTLRTYFGEYQKGGLEELVEDKYVGRLSMLSKDQQKQLSRYLRKNLCHTVKKICFYVQKRFGANYTIEGMTDLLHRLGFSYKKTKIVGGKQDLEKQKEFIGWYQNLKETKQKEDVILFLDGTHPTHNTRSAYGWIKKGEEKYVKTNTGRDRLNLNGALNIENKDVVIFPEDRINAQTTIKLLKELESKYEKGEITCICDNARYYKNRLVTEYLANSRVKLIFLPPYSPNLNPIERLWHFFQKKVLYNKYYQTFVEFKKETLDFFTNLKSYKLELDTFVTDSFHLTPT